MSQTAFEHREVTAGFHRIFLPFFFLRRDNKSTCKELSLESFLRKPSFVNTLCSDTWHRHAATKTHHLFIQTVWYLFRNSFLCSLIWHPTTGATAIYSKLLLMRCEEIMRGTFLTSMRTLSSDQRNDFGKCYAEFLHKQYFAFIRFAKSARKKSQHVKTFSSSRRALNSYDMPVRAITWPAGWMRRKTYWIFWRENNILLIIDSSNWFRIDWLDFSSGERL